MKIVIDSREQLPLDFKTSTHIEGVVIKKLEAGDYSILGYEDKIAIERKSANDLFGTLGKGHKRFNRELARAKGYDYFGIIIEDSFTDIKYKNFENSFYSKMPGFVITKMCMTMKLKYGVDFIFCKDRQEAKDMIREILYAYIKLKEEGKDAITKGVVSSD